MPKHTLYRCKPRDDGNETVLAKLENDRHWPWVVWMHRTRDDTMHWGHYFETYEEALACFEEK